MANMVILYWNISIIADNLIEIAGQEQVVANFLSMSPMDSKERHNSSCEAIFFCMERFVQGKFDLFNVASFDGLTFLNIFQSVFYQFPKKVEKSDFLGENSDFSDLTLKKETFQ